LNRGISSAAILKEIANSAEIAKKIEVFLSYIEYIQIFDFHLCFGWSFHYLESNWMH